MAYKPRDLEELAFGKELEGELNSVIDAYVGPGLEALVNSGESINGLKLRPSDQKKIIVGLAMRMNEKQILIHVNRERTKDGFQPISTNNLKYWRAKFSKVIDEVYAVAATRIGEIYNTADKIVRISRYHELGEAFFDSIKTDIDHEGGIDDLTIKKTNTYIKILGLMNVELGSMPMAKTLKEPSFVDDGDKEKELTRDEIKGIVADGIKERYANQLPSGITEQVKKADEVEVVQS